VTDRQGSVTLLNDSLNKPKDKLGLDYRVALSCLTVGICVALFIYVMFGIALMIALPAVLRFALRKDRQMYRLWCLSFLHSAYYDPGKVYR
jgi:type IV secretory pathway TrbD component